MLKRCKVRGRYRRWLAEMSEVALQQLGHFGGALEALGGILRHQAFDERFQPRGHVGLHLPNGDGRLFADLMKHGESGRAAEGRQAGTHGIKHTSQAEQVGPVIDHLPARLLRRHVFRRAGDHTVPCELHVVRHAGQAEIGNPHAGQAVFQQQVGGLDVPVDQSLRVRRRQPRRRLVADADALDQLQGSRAIEPVLERLARDVLHDEVR